MRAALLHINALRAALLCLTSCLLVCGVGSSPLLIKGLFVSIYFPLVPRSPGCILEEACCSSCMPEGR